LVRDGVCHRLFVGRVFGASRVRTACKQWHTVLKLSLAEADRG